MHGDWLRNKKCFRSDRHKAFWCGTLNEKNLFKELIEIKSDRAKEFLDFFKPQVFSWLIAEQDQLEKATRGEASFVRMKIISGRLLVFERLDSDFQFPTIKN